MHCDVIRIQNTQKAAQISTIILPNAAEFATLSKGHRYTE